MQFKNQVSISLNMKRLLSQNVLPMSSIKDRHPTLPLPPGHKTLLQCSGCVQTKKRVDLAEVSSF